MTSDQAPSIAVDDYTAQIDAPDGSVQLFDPAGTDEPWRALVYPSTASEATEVAWARGQPSRYYCAEHGLSHRYDGCQHTRAAVLAAGIYTADTDATTTEQEGRTR